jgi:phosphatidylglycerophosphatase A
MNSIITAFLGGWEIVLICAVLLILIGWINRPNNFLRRLRDGTKQGVDEFRKASNEVTYEIRDAADRESERARESFSIALFIAQGFGVGRIPFAPGTFGSFAGLLWFAALVATGNFWAYLAGAIEGIAFSIWLCDDAEKILRQKDPGSIVLDEIIAIPFCFLPWVASEWFRHGTLPLPEFFFQDRALALTLLIVVLFRVFDIAKPWPIRQIQRLPGGWGVTVDDLIAAAYCAILLSGLLAFAAK